jgi:hypothetical protein
MTRFDLARFGGEPKRLRCNAEQTRLCVPKTLNPAMVMKSAQDGVRTYETGSLNRPRIGRIFT